MSLRSNIVRRRAIYYFRCRVPADLRASVGRNELSGSLRTSCGSSARRLALPLYTKTARLWRDVRQAMMWEIRSAGSSQYRNRRGVPESDKVPHDPRGARSRRLPGRSPRLWGGEPNRETPVARKQFLSLSWSSVARIATTSAASLGRLTARSASHRSRSQSSSVEGRTPYLFLTAVSSLSLVDACGRNARSAPCSAGVR
jgi:hypothetical protein